MIDSIFKWLYGIHRRRLLKHLDSPVFNPDASLKLDALDALLELMEGGE